MPFINDGGAIVNISSASALCPFGGVSIYSASKAALDNFSVSIASEQKSVSVSSVLPGFVRTDIIFLLQKRMGMKINDFKAHKK